MNETNTVVELPNIGITAEEVGNATERQETRQETVQENKIPTGEELQAMILNAVKDSLTAIKKTEEAEKAEAERLATMTKAERLEHDKNVAEQELAKLKAEIATGKMRDQAREILSGKGVTCSEFILACLVGENAETTKANIENFVEDFNKAVDSEVNRRMQANPPQKTVNKGNGGITKAEILSEPDTNKRLRLIAENQHLF